jgi:hypothetical protein
MQRTRAAIVAALALALTGCAGAPTPIVTPTSFPLDQLQLDSTERNGIEFLVGQDALDQVIAAARTARTVTMTGSYDELLPPPEGQRDPVAGLSLSVTVTGSPSDYTAQVDASGVAGEVRAQQATVVARGSAEFLGTLGAVGDAEWACVPGGTASLAPWQPLLDPAGLIDTLLSVEEGAETDLVVDTGALVGDTVELVISSGGALIGTLVVSAVGPPLPHSLIASDLSGEAIFTFDGWGEEVSLDDVDDLADCD